MQFEENWCIFKDHISAASIVFLEVQSKARLIYTNIQDTVKQMIPHTSEKLSDKEINIVSSSVTRWLKQIVGQSVMFIMEICRECNRKCQG